jgi:alpha-tubulin suppressor-like RCC1 family protein
VSALYRHTCGVTTADRAYCWGRNHVGQLGDGSDSPGRVKPVAVLGGLLFRRVSVGYGHSCGVTADNLGYCWGSNGSGQLGTGSGQGSSSVPVAVQGGLQFREVDLGGGHSCGVTTGNIAYCWGANEGGQLGDGTSWPENTQRPTPVPVAGPM